MASRFSHDRAVARERGDIEPSLIRVRRWTDPATGQSWPGHYTMRYDFRPIGAGPLGDGEPFCVSPHEISERPEDND